MTDDFFDFMVFWELMFPEDENRTVECPHCSRIIKGNEKVVWVEKNKIFKCPECSNEITIE